MVLYFKNKYKRNETKMNFVSTVNELSGHLTNYEELESELVNMSQKVVCAVIEYELSAIKCQKSY